MYVVAAGTAHAVRPGSKRHAGHRGGDRGPRTVGGKATERGPLDSQPPGKVGPLKREAPVASSADEDSRSPAHLRPGGHPPSAGSPPSPGRRATRGPSCSCSHSPSPGTNSGALRRSRPPGERGRSAAGRPPVERDRHGRQLRGDDRRPGHTPRHRHVRLRPRRRAARHLPQAAPPRPRRSHPATGTAVELGGLRFALATCYDSHFPDLPGRRRTAARSTSPPRCTATASPNGRPYPRIAEDTDLFVALANHVGPPARGPGAGPRSGPGRRTPRRGGRPYADGGHRGGRPRQLIRRLPGRPAGRWFRMRAAAVPNAARRRCWRAR
ncbi:hypothetical protein SMICM17S_01058 [Streptomyces microflavus]